MARGTFQTEQANIVMYVTCYLIPSKFLYLGDLSLSDNCFDIECLGFYKKCLRKAGEKMPSLVAQCIRVILRSAGCNRRSEFSHSVSMILFSTSRKYLSADPQFSRYIAEVSYVDSPYGRKKKIGKRSRLIKIAKSQHPLGTTLGKREREKMQGDNVDKMINVHNLYYREN